MISILSSRAVGILHPAASFRVNLARFPTLGPSPVVTVRPHCPHPEPQHGNCLCSKRFLRHRYLVYLFFDRFFSVTAIRLGQPGVPQRAMHQMAAGGSCNPLRGFYVPRRQIRHNLDTADLLVQGDMAYMLSAREQASARCAAARNRHRGNLTAEQAAGNTT